MVEVRLETHEEVPPLLHRGAGDVAGVEGCESLVGGLSERLRVQHECGAGHYEPR